MRMGQNNSKPAGKRPGYYGYYSERFGKYFERLCDLGRYARQQYRKWRMGEIPQLKPPAGGYLHLDKIAKERKVMRGGLIALGYFIPDDWRVVKIWKLGEDEYGIILRIEPLKALSEVERK